MTTLADTSLLELTQTILNSTILLTRGQLQQAEKPVPPSSHAGVNGTSEEAINGKQGHHEVNGHANGLTNEGDAAEINGNSASKNVSKRTLVNNQLSPQDLIDAKIKIVQAAADLTALVQGPANYLKSLSYGYHDITAVSVVLEFNIADAVPLGGEIAFAELAKAVGFDAQRLERILRLLFVRYIFTESRPGFVAHTPASAELATNKELAAFLGHCAFEAFPAASHLASTIRKYPYSELPNQTGFNSALQTDDPLFTFLSKNPARFDRFNLGMAGISQGGGRSAQQVVGGWDWASLGSGTVVDVGGGNGHISIALAEAFPQLNLVVQDLGGAVAEGAQALPASLAPRVRFQAHDMFEVNPVHGADVYYMRHIAHDWPDSHAILIIRALIPALKNGARILVSDSVIPPAGVLNAQDEIFVRYLDMQMMVLHNARERSEEDFKSLFKQADPRLKYQRVWRKGESFAASTILEAKFVEDAA